MRKFYFEFSEHEYYGLVVVSLEESELYEKPYIKAIQHYVDTIAGESVEEVLDEGTPMLVTQEYAFMKFVNANDNLESRVKEVVGQFETIDNGCLLIDSAFM